MQTWKDVFRRKEERQNLKNIGVCFLVIVTLVTGSFALTGLRDIFQVSRNEHPQNLATPGKAPIARNP